MSLRHWRSGVIALGLLASAPAAHAVPRFAREYGVDCHKCHVVPPRLNAFGKAFQANNFNWPGGKPPPRKTGLQAFPVSGIAKLSFEDNRSEGERSTKFRELELFLTNGFRLGGRPAGGYFSSLTAATTEKEEREGNLEQAFVIAPIAGRRGQWTVGAGQLSFESHLLRLTLETTQRKGDRSIALIARGQF